MVDEIKAMEISTDNHELIDNLKGLVHWHKSRIKDLELLSAHADAKLDFGDDFTHQLSPAEIKPFRLGIQLAIALLGDLPLKITDVSSIDNEVDHE